MFKIEVELENRDFRKSLYFYKVDAEKKKNGLRQGAGIIKWTLKKWAAGACQHAP